MRVYNKEVNKFNPTLYDPDTDADILPSRQVIRGPEAECIAQELGPDWHAKNGRYVKPDMPGGIWLCRGTEPVAEFSTWEDLYHHVEDILKLERRNA